MVEVQGHLRPSCNPSTSLHVGNVTFNAGALILRWLPNGSRKPVTFPRCLTRQIVIHYSHDCFTVDNNEVGILVSWIRLWACIDIKTRNFVSLVVRALND